MSGYENVEAGRIVLDHELKTVIIEHTIEEKCDPWPWFLGYVIDEGDMLRLYGCFSEEDVDKLIEEFKATGRITLKDYAHRDRVETPSPCMVYKLPVTKALFRKVVMI